MFDQLRQYDVVWDSPSKDASGSMPLGNGDIGLNVWAEENGDLLLLVSKSDAWDENCSLLKLGRLRVNLSPNPFAAGQLFKQSLRLESGEITIEAGDVSLRVWVDANHPFSWIEIESRSPIEVVATIECWRREPRQIKTQTGDMFKNLTGKDPYPTIVYPDRFLPHEPNRVTVCHHNEVRANDAFAINMKLQGLGELMKSMQHPLLHRTFGMTVTGEGFVAESNEQLRSTTARTAHRLAVVALTKHPSTVEAWSADIARLAHSAVEPHRAAHVMVWWNFWEKSWIFVSSPDVSERQATHDITRGYLLQRFMNACAGRAPQPIKHNGSLFTVGRPDDPDFRRWGGPGFWFMNQRLMYWPMLASGDYDLMLPWLRMYRDQLELQRHRTKKYFGHAGAHYPETVTFWGADLSAHYGWTPFEERTSPVAECAYLTYYWSGGIELTLILLTYFNHTQDEAFAKEFLLPIADAITEFYDQHYPRDAYGKIRFDPAQALETWHWAINPLPEIAGLRYVLPKLMKLSSELLPQALRERCDRIIEQLPPTPIGERDGKQVVLPGEQVDKKKNTENPELYAIFPYRLFGIDKPDLQLARGTFAARLHQSHDCWSQDDLQMALLGLPDDAAKNLAARASDASHSDSRFPAFWNAFKDWLPDMDHGGVLQMTLQEMLMQCEDDRIHLLPAWPKGWDANFKLHAPGRTVIQGRVRNGKVEELQVEPKSREKDVLIPSPFGRGLG